MQDNFLEYKHLLLIMILFVFVSFTYNMTNELNNETRLLNACIAFNLSLKECDDIYGSIPK